MKLNETMKRVRFEKRMTQEQLAQAVEVSRQTIMMIESGKTDPAFSIVQRIGKQLGVSLDEMDIPPATRK